MGTGLLDPDPLTNSRLICRGHGVRWRDAIQLEQPRAGEEEEADANHPYTTKSNCWLVRLVGKKNFKSVL